jgi:exosome complex RNA-binding protein Rrp42 (RNase PH superfamily)
MRARTKLDIMTTDVVLVHVDWLALSHDGSILAHLQVSMMDKVLNTGNLASVQASVEAQQESSQLRCLQGGERGVLRGGVLRMPCG